MRHYMAIAMAACVLAAIASSASAWFFIDDGHVFPTWGYANDTVFTWWIKVQLDGQEQPPEVLIGIGDHGVPLWGWEQMQFTVIPDNQCYYWTQHQLYYTAGVWAFIFTVDYEYWTMGQIGPTVYP